MDEEVKGEKTEGQEGALPKETKDDLEERIKAAVLAELEPNRKEIANLKRQLSRTRQLLELDDDQKAALIDHEAVREEILETLAAKGVPRKLLERGLTLKDVREIGTDYLESLPEKANDDAVTAAATKVAAQVRGTGPSSERVASHPVGASAGPGKENYAELLKSGKPMPSAAEIDRMTAKYVS